MNTAIVSTNLPDLGVAANRFAEQTVFSDYQARKAHNTLERQADDLACFAMFLKSVGAEEAPNLYENPYSWRGVSWGLVDTFTRWMLQSGYSINTINFRLSTVKVYASMASRAGAITGEELSMIRNIRPYSHKEGRRIDERRVESNVETRIGHKKAFSTSLTIEQLNKLKDQPNDLRGRRDFLILAVFIDLGLRVGELRSLEISNFDLLAGTLKFYREKVGIEQTHLISKDILDAANNWFPLCNGLLWNTFNRKGKLKGRKMGVRNIFCVVRENGFRIEEPELSPHDLRHAWATDAARNGTPLETLMQAGGWASYAMPLRYIEAAKIANQGVKQDRRNKLQKS
jgi:integrase